jgi:hypothetical protein
MVGFGRIVTVAAIAIGLFAGVGSDRSTARQAGSAESAAASLIGGGCDEPGEVVAELRPLTASEGGVLTSFTTIDLAIGEVTGGGYAVVVGEANAPAACGELSGAGDDIYVALRERHGSGLGGVAWLHAREARTQISLFVGEGLGGATTGTPSDDPDGPPEPPTEETPEPDPADDPADDLGTYTAPTYGYSISYDADLYGVQVDETRQTPFAPLDYFALATPTHSAYVEFMGFGAWGERAADTYLLGFVGHLRGNAEYSDVAVRLDAAGDPIEGGDAMHAYVAIDFSFTNAAGKLVQKTWFAEGWQIPGKDAFLMMLYQTRQDAFDEWTEEREALGAGIALPE